MMITILAYKPDSDDYCRGCVMARYSSNFQFKSSTEPDAMATFFAELLFAHKHLDHGEAQHEITWLFDGADHWEDPAIDAVQAEITKRATQLAEAQEQEYQRKKTAAEEKQKRDALAAQERQEQKQLQALKEKYER